MTIDISRLSDAMTDFLAERHLAALTTLRRDGSPHVVAVGFTFDPNSGTARVITSDGSVKVRNSERPGPGGTAPRAAICQINGRRWLTLEGIAVISRVPDEVADAERRYAARYRTPRINPRRVVLTIAVDRILGHG